ncbi:MAG TPA: hypothetical protein VGW38_22805, partial [Chloroflexota bacterium]|nr:hypothetical protein [Chloroflexota bacterium]
VGPVTVDRSGFVSFPYLGQSDHNRIAAGGEPGTQRRAVLVRTSPVRLLHSGHVRYVLFSAIANGH